MGGDFVGEAAHGRLAEEADHDAADGDFGADVKEDAEGAEAKVAELPGAAAVGGCCGVGFFDDVGELDEGGDGGHGEGADGEDEVGHADGVGKLGGGGSDGDEDEGCADAGRGGGGDGVEEADEVEAGGGGVGGSEGADVGVDGDLQEGEAAADDEEGEEEERIEDDDRRGKEEKQAEAHDRERDDDAGFVAEPADDPAGGDGHDEVGSEEAELDEERGDVGEVEEVFEVGDEDVVERGDEADAEVEGDHQHERDGVVFPACVGEGDGIFSRYSKCHALSSVCGAVVYF